MSQMTEHIRYHHLDYSIKERTKVYMTFQKFQFLFLLRKGLLCYVKDN